MTYERKCKHWIQSFTDWTRPRSQAPDSCLMWTALFTIAAAVRKHVKIPKKYLGSWECYPNLYVVLVGEPGVINKSTTMGFGDTLLQSLPEIPSSPTEISKAALIVEMAESQDSTLYITAGELSQVISRSKMDMYDYLTVSYDTTKPLRGRTIMGGKVTIDNPCLNLFACTQPAWIVENMPQSVIGGGFTSRTVMLLEMEPRQVRLFYTELEHKALDKIQERLTEDLVHISNIHGEFKIDEDVEHFLEDWNRETYKKRGSIHPNLKPFYARRAVHVLKIAMLFRLAYSDDLRITKTDAEFAISQFNYTLKRIENLFKQLGRNEYTPDLNNIREFIAQKNGVTYDELLREFSAVATPVKLEELILGLVTMKYVKIVQEAETNRTLYVAT